MIAFIQPFHLRSAGGGPRILRALLDCQHPPTMSVATSLVRPTNLEQGEVWLPPRPSFRRLESTRFQKYLTGLESWFQPRFESALLKLLRAHSVQAMHLIPHGYDIVGEINVAIANRIPFFLNVHDELSYTAIGHPHIDKMMTSLQQGWSEAQGIFVISEEIGEEYCLRYGRRDYIVVTDGLKSVAETPQPRPAHSLRIYFMGLFHHRYGTNLRALLDALKLVRSQNPNWEISVTCRCDFINVPILPDDVPVSVLPFAPESEVQKDMLSADMLYQPLPFDADAVMFGKFSLSTKMVTYIGSGLPILYHGPEDTAANHLLKRHQAAITCTTLDPRVIAGQLIEATEHSGDAIVQNALTLAREQFLLKDQQARFWKSIEAIPRTWTGQA